MKYKLGLAVLLILNTLNFSTYAEGVNGKYNLEHLGIPSDDKKYEKIFNELVKEKSQKYATSTNEQKKEPKKELIGKMKLIKTYHAKIDAEIKANKNKIGDPLQTSKNNVLHYLEEINRLQRDVQIEYKAMNVKETGFFTSSNSPTYELNALIKEDQKARKAIDKEPSYKDLIKKAAANVDRPYLVSAEYTEKVTNELLKGISGDSVPEDRVRNLDEFTKRRNALYDVTFPDLIKKYPIAENPKVQRLFHTSANTLYLVEIEEQIKAGKLQEPEMRQLKDQLIYEINNDRIKALYLGPENTGYAQDLEKYTSEKMKITLKSKNSQVVSDVTNMLNHDLTSKGYNLKPMGLTDLEPHESKNRPSTGQQQGQTQDQQQRQYEEQQRQAQEQQRRQYEEQQRQAQDQQQRQYEEQQRQAQDQQQRQAQDQQQRQAQEQRRTQWIDDYQKKLGYRDVSESEKAAAKSSSNFNNAVERMSREYKQAYDFALTGTTNDAKSIAHLYEAMGIEQDVKVILSADQALAMNTKQRTKLDEAIKAKKNFENKFGIKFAGQQETFKVIDAATRDLFWKTGQPDMNELIKQGSAVIDANEMKGLEQKFETRTRILEILDRVSSAQSGNSQAVEELNKSLRKSYREMFKIDQNYGLHSLESKYMQSRIEGMQSLNLRNNNLDFLYRASEIVELHEYDKELRKKPTLTDYEKSIAATRDAKLADLKILSANSPEMMEKINMIDRQITISKQGTSVSHTTPSSASYTNLDVFNFKLSSTPGGVDPKQPVDAKTQTQETETKQQLDTEKRQQVLENANTENKFWTKNKKIVAGTIGVASVVTGAVVGGIFGAKKIKKDKREKGLSIIYKEPSFNGDATYIPEDKVVNISGFGSAQTIYKDKADVEEGDTYSKDYYIELTLYEGEHGTGNNVVIRTQVSDPSELSIKQVKSVKVKRVPKKSGIYLFKQNNFNGPASFITSADFRTDFSVYGFSTDKVRSVDVVSQTANYKVTLASETEGRGTTVVLNDPQQKLASTSFGDVQVKSINIERR